MALKTEDLRIGEGPMAFAGKTVTVHYTGWLFDPAAEAGKGRQFDCSRTRGEVFRFRIGDRQVIPGWERGVAGMRVGGERRLIIPPEFAYGREGHAGVIPPQATLVFDIELLGAA
jgi:FKBP-type peptidyl-prolyl cis-trans isomerase FkpA